MEGFFFFLESIFLGKKKGNSNNGQSNHQVWPVACPPLGKALGLTGFTPQFKSQQLQHLVANNRLLMRVRISWSAHKLTSTLDLKLKNKNKNEHSYDEFRASPTKLVNFCTVWRMNSDFHLYLSTFSNILCNRLFISFKYYLFIHYLLFF